MDDRWLTDTDYNYSLPFYTRANAGEVLPDPASPLGWTLAFEQGVLKGWARGFVDFGLFRADEVLVDQPPFVGSFGGFFYLNLSMMRRMAVRMGVPVEAFDASMLGDLSDAPAYDPHPDDDCAECSTKIAKTMEWVLSTESFPEIDEDRRRVLTIRTGRPDLGMLTDAELVARARSILPELDNGFYRHVFSSLPSSVGPAQLAEICAQLGRPDAALELISGLGDVDSAGPSTGLWSLARIVRGSKRLSAAFDHGSDTVVDRLRAQDDAEWTSLQGAIHEFLDRFGFRGPNEWDIHSDSWEANPRAVLALVDRLRKAPDADAPDSSHEVLADRRTRLADDLRVQLADDPEKLASFETALRSASVFVPARERTKTTIVIAMNEMRMTLRELGRRHVGDDGLQRPSDVMMLLASELDDFVRDPPALASVIADRRSAYDELWDLVPPYVTADTVRPLGEWPRRSTEGPAAAAEPGDVLEGVGGCGGKYTGSVRVLEDPSDPFALEPGDVLVAPLTDTAWTPLFLLAGAVIVDVGATNSHAVVVCRELGRPCVVSVTDATKRLRDGSVVTVDGGSGKVAVETVPALVA